MDQIQMFSAGTGTPLFSGTCQRARKQEYKPKAKPKQESLFDCSVCRDTGYVVIKGKRQNCICKKGIEA
jgi:hypothetical protein